MNKLVSQATDEFVTGEDRIDIWYVDLTLSGFECLDLLSEDEIIRSKKMLNTENKNLFIRSRCALRLILANCLSLNPREISFQYGEKGKPKLDVPSSTQLEFNLSHSNDIALIAVGTKRQIGIDISHTNRSTNWQGIAKRNFTESEQAYLMQTGSSQTEVSRNHFHRIWSQKEAYTKALGLGFSYGFKNFSVELDGGLREDNISPDAIKLWTIKSFEPEKDSVAALAFSGSTQPKIYAWKLDPPSNSSINSNALKYKFV
ncbi:MAG: 4'-phosphopantetheinyl transferase superfamily protein [Pseudomonadales bacterium]|nr:4'-phosphopantetheinyl transferase superfamily protein [Pseudomonadales bacterium]